MSGNILGYGSNVMEHIYLKRHHQLHKQKLYEIKKRKHSNKKYQTTGYTWDSNKIK